MGEKTVQADKAPKKSWFKGIKSEFNKIVWPDKDSLIKQTGTVIVATIILGVIVSVLDTVIKLGINWII